MKWYVKRREDRSARVHGVGYRFYSVGYQTGQGLKLFDRSHGQADLEADWGVGRVLLLAGLKVRV